MYYGTTTCDMLRDQSKFKKALALRKSGKSIRNIAKTLKISTSTASIWCREIQLSPQQRQLLDLKPGNRELLRNFALKRHQDKLKYHTEIFNSAKNQISKLSGNEFFLTGLALYWAEGFKNKAEGRIGFSNSDARMIKFMLNWFQKILKITSQDFILRAEFNSSHVSRQEEIEDYWSKITSVPRLQFNKPYLKETKFLRDYSNHGIYYGVLRIRIRRSSALLTKLKGYIEGLSLEYYKI